MTSITRTLALRVPLVAVALLAVELSAAIAQDVPYYIFHPDPDTLVHALRGRPFAMLHVELFDSLPSAIELYEPLGRTTPHTRPPAEPLQDELSRSREAYDRGDFHLAADIAGSALAADSANPFVLDAYARALFRIPERRPESKQVYERLVRILDMQIPGEDTIIRVDIHFAEAYSKLGALHLDYAQYDSAAFELTRAVLAVRTWGRRGSPEFLARQLSYLTEAYTELGLAQVARWFAGATLHIDPANQYVLQYLERLGPGSEGVLECSGAGDSAPQEGVYALAVRQPEGARTLECMAPEEDLDGTVAPCLRIGRIFVGMNEEGVRRNIGIPARATRTEAGRDAFIHLLFMNQRTEEAAYYVLEYEEVAGERVVYSVQLTGQRPPLPVSFSCVELGSTGQEVLRQLGPPTSVDTVSLQMLDAPVEVWNYVPLPISIEIMRGEVYSIKTWRPDELSPLSRKPSLFYRK